MKKMKPWTYENEQWTQLPIYLRHLPLVTRHFDWFSIAIRGVWAFIMKMFIFRFYLRLEVLGDLNKTFEENPKALVISNHCSHLDAVSISTAVPFKYWVYLYAAAAKDYFFSNWLYSFFSKHCIGAIPIDRKDKKGEAVNICLTLLKTLPAIWLIIFPEGTRSKDGYVHRFKRGVSLFSKEADVPILFIYIENAFELWPKGYFFSKPGKLKMHIGPVHPPGETDVIYASYKSWVKSINPNAFADDLEQPPIHNEAIEETDPLQ